MEHHEAKVKERCRKGACAHISLSGLLKRHSGIPDSLRGKAWFKLTGACILKEGNGGEYARLVKTSSQITEGPLMPYYDVIEKDLDRTYPHHTQFKMGTSNGQVCPAYTKQATGTLAFTFRRISGTCCGLMHCAIRPWDTRKGWA